MLFTKGNALSAYIYITNPALLFIVILLFYSILKIFVKNTYISFFLSLVVLFFPFICFNNIISISASIFHIDANKINAIYDKFGTIINYPILFLFFDLKTINFLLLLLIGVYTYSFNKKASIGIFGVAPVFSPLLLTLPASYFTIQLFSKKERKVHLLLIPLFIIIYFILIKFILSSQNNINAFNEFILYPYICNLKAKTLINYFLVVILSTFIFGFIYWLAFFIYYKFIPNNKKNQILNWSFLLLIGIILFSILATFINYGNINCGEYITYNNFFLSYIGFIFLIFVIIHFINQIKNVKKQKLIKIITFIIFSFFLIQGLFILIKDSKNSNNNSQNEYKSNNIILSKTNNESDMIKIGVININTYINSINNNLIYFLYIPTLYIKESYFYDNKNSYKVVSVLLDTLPQNIKLSDDSCLNLYYINELKKFLPFDIYWNKNYADNPIPIDSAKMNFIREQKMNYILLYKGAIYKDTLPSYFRPYVDTFYILEPNEDTLFKIQIDKNYTKKIL